LLEFVEHHRLAGSVGRCRRLAAGRGAATLQGGVTPRIDGFVCRVRVGDIAPWLILQHAAEVRGRENSGAHFGDRVVGVGREAGQDRLDQGGVVEEGVADVLF
jgi:hypothetical protein